MCLAIPGKIEQIQGNDPLMRSAKVSFEGIAKEVNLAFVPEANVGDYVLVHVGCAIARIDEAEARKIFAHLKEIGELEELEAERDPP